MEVLIEFGSKRVLLNEKKKFGKSLKFHGGLFLHLCEEKEETEEGEVGGGGGGGVTV